MSVILLTLPLLWAQVNPAAPGQAPAPTPAAAQAGTPAQPGAAAAPAGGPAARPAALPQIEPSVFISLMWIYFISDPSVGDNKTLLAAGITWLKAISLICLVGWLFSWVISGIKERVVARGEWFDYLGIAALVLTPATVMIQVLQGMQRIGAYGIGPLPLVTALWLASLLLYAVWIEVALWRTTRRLGTATDRAVLIGIHLAMALGLGIGLWIQQRGYLIYLMPFVPINTVFTWREGLVVGVRMGLTYMGYVVLLRVAGQFLVELYHARLRRLFAIAQLSVYEATRRMWAPWVVIVVFLLVLAFTHWFLQPPRAAEMGRLYVGTLTLLVSVLLTVMVTILTPLSLPTDIQQQTIYTVVSKPVRRLEMIWGRMIGYMALVTVLLVAFGGISLAYLWRTVGGTIKQTEAALIKAEQAGRLAEAKVLREQWDQLYTRMTAREPIKGSLSFLDSRGNPKAMGIDVGQDVSGREPRSHIEGATPSTAIWSFGRVPDPFTLPGRAPRILDRRIAVEQFLPTGTLEWQLDRIIQLDNQVKADEATKNQPGVSAARSAQLDLAIDRNRREYDRLAADYAERQKQAEDLEARRADAEAAGRKDEAEGLQKQLDQMHAPPVAVEMTFNVYRTTKGRIGEPVYAEITARNPYTGAEFEGDIFAIREYYTNKVTLPPKLLAGSNGALRVEIRCLSPTQYLGMAESDLFLLPRSGSFGVNYMKGLFGIWLQAMVLTAIGVFAGTFLSWPVALSTTIFFFVSGQLAFSFLVNFTRQAVMGGGPFESLIRLLTHDNQMSELAPTAAVILAKTLDSLVMPLMSMLIYVVPNFNALDVSNLVADGFAVSWNTLGVNTLLALGYALPFSIAGYFILKKREVAA